MFEGLRMRLFIWLATRWFPHLSFTSDPETGSVITMVFSCKKETISKVMDWMVDKEIL